MTESTPAPIPGSGLLSYLCLGLSGLLFYRKRLWRPVRFPRLSIFHRYRERPRLAGQFGALGG